MKKSLSFLLFIGVACAAFAYQLPAPDSLGNRIPDFSYSGYRASETPIPAVAVKLVVPPATNDATALLQAAIDKVAARKPDANGFRGAILLQAGDYKVAGQLRISASGIVIRGSGADKTNLIAAGLDRRTLIRIEGVDNRKYGDTLKVADKYVPVGAMSFTVNSTKSIKTGDRITLVRPSTKAWIDALGTAHLGGGITSLGWKPNEHNIYWDRTIVAIDGNKITVDAPVTTALDAKYGGGFALPYVWNGRIENVGVENINFISEYDAANAKDENHSWMAITVGNAADVWVRNCFFHHFASSAVYVLETARRITVENCKYLAPMSEIGAHRRYAFFTMGQQCLFQRLYSEYGYHDFALGFCTPGPNAFVQCTAFLPYSYSGSIDSWASGVLFDIVNIEGNALKYTNLWQAEKGAAWNAANSVFWQCSPSEMDCFAPPTAMNWAIGSWSAYNGNGFWAESNNHVEPRSLFYTQLEKRLGADYEDRSDLIQIRTNPTSSPTIALARQLTDAARTPATLLTDWIDTVIMKNPIVSETSGVEIMKMPQQKPQIAANKSFIKIENGKIVRDGKILTGGSHKIQYWSGTDQPAYLKTASPHITRYVPGRTGTGLTDDIDSVVVWMKRRNIVAFDHNYGLWYDRRRDDHERIRRMNGDVWAPFYEQPFARSGEGAGYDGLSKYDLTKFNPWYWSRLKRFADLADSEGLVLLHEHFFQHNIIEAGAHWADSPWRTANNINNTGFPEPVPYAGDKRLFLAEQFYDVTNAHRRDLQRNYIRKCLENFRDNHSVIHFISAEYTGPLHFVEFWLDVIAEWEQETGLHPLIALSATKDVQDAILADPKRARTVDIIDIRYWHYREDGTLYAPVGGQNLAPRQHARQVQPGRTSYDAVYRAVSEYRTKFPDKAITYYSESYPQFSWAVLMAGGSLPAVPKVDEMLFKAAATMSVKQDLNTATQYVLGNEKSYIVYTTDGNINLKVNDFPAQYKILWLNMQSGKLENAKPQERATVAFVERK